MLRAAAIVALLLPQLALGAGFAKQSLFLSHLPVTEGETVLIHAVVNNDALVAFVGEMIFTEGPTTIGKAAVSLDPGEAAALSVSWKPAAGSHTIVAELKKGSEVVERQSATFKIDAKPVPVTPTPSSSGSSSGSQTAAAIESSEKIQESIAGLSPSVAGAVAPAFRLVDGGRAALSEVIDQQVSTTKKNLGGTVLSAQTVKDAPQNPGGSFWLILWTLYLYLLTLLGFIINSAGIFYPFLAILVLYILWRLVRRARRPA